MEIAHQIHLSADDCKRALQLYALALAKSRGEPSLRDVSDHDFCGRSDVHTTGRVETEGFVKVDGADLTWR